MSRRRIVPIALFAAAALISAFTMLRGIDHFDEGLALQAARRVAGGEVPYRDFLWSYGPANPYLLGGLFELLGPSLVHWRVLRVLADAGVALLAFVLVRRHAGDRWALLAWLAVACQMAQPRNANPFPFAMLAALAAVALVSAGGGTSRKRLVWSGLLVGAAAAYRIDFALYGFAAVAAVVALETRRLRAVALYAAVAGGAGLLAYAPFLVALGPADLYDALIGTSLRERDYWTLPFPWSFDGSIGSPEGWKDALDFYVPALLLAGTALAAVGLLWRTVRERRPDPLGAGLAVLAVGFLSYLLSRTDEVHTTPLFVVLAVMLPLVAAWSRRAAGPAGRWLAYPAALVFALLLVHGAANRGSALLRPPQLATLDVDPADGVRIPPEEARAIERVDELVRARVPRDEPIYVAPARSDRVRFNDSLMYVLVGRDNASRVDYGLIARPGPQRAIVADLERARPRVVVRWTAPVASQEEPNLRGRASGVRILDDWIARHYRLEERLHHYDVLVPR